jgi:hypothetical protein
MVYLHEIALPEYKTVTGSLGFVSLGIGVVVGICVVAAVIYTVPAGRGRRRLPPARHHARSCCLVSNNIRHVWGGAAPAAAC